MKAVLEKSTVASGQTPVRSACATWAKRVICIIVWQLLALLLAELILYSAGMGEEEIFRFNDQVGFVHMPNKRVTWRQEGWGARSYFDQNGMREPNLTVLKPASTYRVALLGDSVVEGLQVPIELTYGQMLSRQLTRKFAGKYKEVQVLNFGTSGYSTVQEYLLLKNKVFKYKPDLVILGYSSRDLFENCTPPDQAMANVRPFALQLPNSRLVVDSSPVRQWLRTPRGRFLAAIGWIREHSRIWGLIAAHEQQLSLSDPAYKAISAFISQPGKTFRAAVSAAPFVLKNVTGQMLSAWKKAFVPEKLATNSQVLPNTALPSPPASAPNAVPAVSTNENFLNLLIRTMGSLLGEMKSDCAAHNARFGVLILPNKPMLCPNYKAADSGSGLDYDQEAKIMQKLCQSDGIDLIDAEKPATALTDQEKSDLFFNVHLTPLGHRHVANALMPYLTKQLDSTSKPTTD